MDTQNTESRQRRNGNNRLFSTGLNGLDAILHGLRGGDNVVWQVDRIEDYHDVVKPFAAWAARQPGGLIYFRFASHPPILSPQPGLSIRELDPQMGFERFVSAILDAIERRGAGGLYVFDGLSELAADWFSDRMLANFFMIVCPYLFQLDTIAYFALFQKSHSAFAIEGIHRTAQVILDLYRHGDGRYIKPVKVDQRHSPTMFMLHVWEGETFRPLTQSAAVAEVFSGAPQPWLSFAARRPGTWARAVQRARDVLAAMREGQASMQDVQEAFNKLLRMAVTRDERFIRLARKHFALEDLVIVLERMIGTGLIGGKSLGMLLGRAILRNTRPRWNELLEPHDSFYIGSDVFYTYLVQNGCWHLRRNLKAPTGSPDGVSVAQERIMRGEFPPDIRQQFVEMLDYFGQAPIIVRSSSLLEDSYGNAFSGKYETVFCANQGDPEDRLQAFIAAVRRVYASAISNEALSYRAQRGLLDCDEQMSLLVQRVSGSLSGSLFFPHVAGVGFSFNPYVWAETIDPHSGFLRLVAGLGTRAVDRTDDDYSRLVALNAPTRRPDAGDNESRRHLQRRVDVLDLEANALVSREWTDLVRIASRDFPLGLMAELDPETEKQVRERGLDPALAWRPTFDPLLSATSLPADMRDMLSTIHAAYDHPVDIEFTVNFLPDGSYRINLLQCRPFQVRIRGATALVRLPAPMRRADVIMESRGPIIGQSLAAVVDRIIYVAPSVYGQMPVSARYAVARAIGKLTRLAPAASGGFNLMLIGPGRWATTTPALGIPVSFAEISAARIICEIASMHHGLVPDLSLGTHFFNDLVESDMLYLAIFPEREGHGLNEVFFNQAPNRLTELLPEASPLQDALKVVDGSSLPQAAGLRLTADCLKQRAVCHAMRPRE